MQSQGFIVNANLAYGTDWDMTDSLEIFAEQLNKLADFYVENPKIIPSSILNIKLESIFDKNNISKRSCGSGRRMCSVSQEGKIYHCHMFMPSSFGENKNISEIQNKLENGILLEKKCIDCYMSAICPTCYGMNLIICGDLSKRREDYCKMMKVRTLAATYMFGTMLSSKNFSEYEVSPINFALCFKYALSNKSPEVKEAIDNFFGFLFVDEKSIGDVIRNYKYQGFKSKYEAYKRIDEIISEFEKILKM